MQGCECLNETVTYESKDTGSVFSASSNTYDYKDAGNVLSLNAGNVFAASLYSYATVL